MRRLQFLNSDGIIHLLFFGLFSIVLLSGLFLINSLNLGFQIKSSEKNITWLLILFSYPHFMASYYWFYNNESLSRDHRWVGKFFPALLILILFCIYFFNITVMVQPLLLLAWMLLFWHFVKQSYGCSVFLAKNSFSANSKSLLLFSYLSLAGFGFLNIQRTEAKILLFKSYVSVHKVPFYFSEVLLGVAFILFLGFGFTYLRHNHALKKSVKFRSLVMISIPWIANLMWFSWWTVENFFVLIPLFHAIQYGPFILQGIARLQNQPKNFFKIIASIFIFSTAVFVGVPYLINTWWPQMASSLVTSVFIFFNLHHFFIDSVGWRLSQESLRKILFS